MIMEKSRQVLGTTLTATEYNKVMQVEVKALIFVAGERVKACLTPGELKL